MKKPVSIVLLVAIFGLCLVAFPPFLATLELHHALGAADEDGHQHSAAELCSWVQSHASSSVVDCAPTLASQPATQIVETAYQDRTIEHVLLANVPARAPPSSFL